MRLRKRSEDRDFISILLILLACSFVDSFILLSLQLPHRLLVISTRLVVISTGLLMVCTGFLVFSTRFYSFHVIVNAGKSYEMYQNI